MQTARSQRDEYNHWDDYDQELAQEGYYIPSWTGSTMAQLLSGGNQLLSSSKRVLDVGCGTGLVGVAMRRAGFLGILMGTDIAEKRLAQAHFRPYAALFQASAYHLPLQDSSFDAVISAGMVGLAGVTSLYEMARVLRPEGVLAVSVGCIKRRAASVRIYRRARQLMNDWPGMRLLRRIDLGSGYGSGYTGEHFMLFVLRKS